METNIDTFEQLISIAKDPPFKTVYDTIVPDPDDCKALFMPAAHGWLKCCRNLIKQEDPYQRLQTIDPDLIRIVDGLRYVDSDHRHIGEFLHDVALLYINVSRMITYAKKLHDDLSIQKSDSEWIDPLLETASKTINPYVGYEVPEALRNSLLQKAGHIPNNATRAQVVCNIIAEMALYLPSLSREEKDASLIWHLHQAGFLCDLVRFLLESV